MTSSTNNSNPRQNRILAGLSTEEYERLHPHMEEVKLHLGDVLARPDEPIEYVYFPHRGTLSVIATMEDGSEIEVGVIGNEGMSGLPVVLGTNSMPLKTIVQIANGATRMRSDALREEVVRGGQFQKSLLCYGHAFFVQTAQTAACNRLHRLDGRLARLLLMCQDRTRSDELELTHEFLAAMLGVRRAGVSEAAARLQAEGVISYSRARIHIVDRKGLEAASCECYEVVKKEFERLFSN
ncbi:MAG TPA: Crp/Fnr family transcriptional regulator [Pyrinomonadaceae bacterium]|jgi:CRP-like cAMP-binding protein|nr:Crp/Fnr family transcriptional regulator [Pyrinomonadaceae bacterium]